MDIASAVQRIPARELTRRGVWLATFLATVLGRCINGDSTDFLSGAATTTANNAVKAYEEKFPQSQ